MFAYEKEDLVLKNHKEKFKSRLAQGHDTDRLNYKLKNSKNVCEVTQRRQKIPADKLLQKDRDEDSWPLTQKHIGLCAELRRE